MLKAVNVFDYVRHFLQFGANLCSVRGCGVDALRKLYVFILLFTCLRTYS